MDREVEVMKEAPEHTPYSWIVGGYLMVNGLYGLALAVWLVVQQPEIPNRIAFGLVNVVIPCVAAIIGHFVLIQVPGALRWSGYYFMAALPIAGVGTWQYAFTHGLSLGLKLELSGVLLGVNLLPLLGLWLLLEHGKAVVGTGRTLAGPELQMPGSGAESER
ncbi:hypothetical protein DFQ59_10566 [Thioalbus denitrificans]|uniref:Uncharacterized protein n=2 Tax=Thioalbus denitrificans TaxID=547122 RepID=A0A369CEJ2_9GAMM|nr:hypothetical protein DFQ59_10566 [Thioalbus denitrificans]